MLEIRSKCWVNFKVKVQKPEKAQLGTLGHTNLFNCFTESPPKISENSKKKKLKFRKKNIYFSRRRGFIHFKVKKKEKGDSVDVVRTSTGYISAYANNLRARKRNIIQFHIDSMYKYM